MHKNKQTPKKENKTKSKRTYLSHYRNWFKTNDGKGSENIANCEFFFCFTNYSFNSKLGGLSKYLIMAFKDVHFFPKAFSLINFVVLRND